MSKEALHKTGVEYKKQKKEMDDIDLAISKLEKLRDKDQKILNHKRTRKIELETKITQNTHDQKKPLPQDQIDKLVEEKREMESELAEIVRDIPVYTGIVDDYNDKIQELKKRKDEITPQLASAKNESLKEKIGYVAKNYWKHALKAIAASAILYGGYEYGKSSVEENKNKDGTEQTTPTVPPRDNGEKAKEKPDNRADYDDGLDKSKESRRGGSKKKETKPVKQKEDSRHEESIINKNYDLDPSHGDLSKKTENKKVGMEWNVFNSFNSSQTAIQKEGKSNMFYVPYQLGQESPYWNKKQGSESINNQQDYVNHINKNLIPEGFSGNTFSNIKYFGFKLKKNEFISDSKYDVIVRAGVVGGEGYVLLKKGTRVVFERQLDSQGRFCNVLAYILDCMNPIYANDPHTNVDGSGGFKL